jgi:hypothetical protein
VRQISKHRRRARREGPGDEADPPILRDPDVVRAKALNPAGRVPPAGRPEPSTTGAVKSKH